MKMHIEVSLDTEEEADVVGDFVHAVELWAPPSLSPTSQVQRKLAEAWGGIALSESEWDTIGVYLDEVVTDDRLFSDASEDARMHAYRNAVCLRGLVYECGRAVRQSSPTTIAVHPGP